MAMGSRTPGPQHLFARFRGYDTVFYLGTCVAAPRPRHEKARIPVMNDLTGRSEPFQIIKDGENALVAATMNRFDWPLLQSIRGLDAVNIPPPAPAGGNLAAGSEVAFTRGTFVLGLTDFQLLIFWEYADVAGSSGDVLDQAPIRQYNSVELAACEESTEGTRVLEVACAFRCVSIYNKAGRNFAGGTGNTAGGLYTESPARLGGVTPASLRALIAAAGN